MKCYLVGILIFLISCSNNNQDMKTEFENIFNSKFSDNEPGGVVLVKKGDDIVFLKSYGISDLKTGERITEHTIFNTGSISKTFVSNGILILEERKLLSLEDNIDKYFDDFDNKEIAKKVKIKHLLSHNSGLPDLRNVDENIGFYITAMDKENFEPLKRTDSLTFQPGEKFEYSNPAFNGLALIIEKVSGQKWQDFIRDNIFMPSGMTNSYITDGAYPYEGVAHAYTPENEVFFEDDYGEYPTFAASGNGGIWCSILDLVKYEKAIRNFTFLRKESIDKSRKIYKPENWNDTINPEVGFSWFIVEKEMKSNDFEVKIVSHTGWQGGFRAFYISIPEKDILYIGLFNRPISNLSESYNPFINPENNLLDIRVRGVELLKNNKWLD